MRTILFIIQKELLQIKRNKTMLPIIFVIPIIQLVILVHAATMEMQNIDIFIVDKDLSSTSRLINDKFKASKFFRVSGYSNNLQDGEQALLSDKADIILHIPADFERDLIHKNKSDIQLLINAINGTVAGIGNVYAQSILVDINKKIIIDWYNIADESILNQGIQILPRYWYNPVLDYKTYMVPGILVLLITIIGMFLSGMNLVREKEIGTIEQINVTPIRKHQFIIGKLFPFLIIALFELAFGLLTGKLFFDIPLVGSIALVFFVATVYLLVILGFGLFISIITETQQQAMFISWFFAMIFMLMSGLFTATESMPEWAQFINKANPIAYFIKVIRMVLLKGSDFYDIKNEIFSLSIYASIILSLSVLTYRKRA